MYGIFVGQNGKVVGNDGIDDSRVYALKTTESKFANDVAGAGLSREALDATVKFIKKNSGNASEFRSNSIAYDNSIEIEGSATVRRAMIDIIEQDNSRGGASDQNNREYLSLIHILSTYYDYDSSNRLKEIYLIENGVKKIIESYEYNLVHQ